ncbi:MAG: hypothetical protein COV74_00680 [Candidatus Omnitrophica bacterium CG11_big_fil_rev_8_21_14_0_20_45_26]|uniref:Peptidase M48 domain-containing protein n=1 Tax=Candidatus Abzuiibacterium crystallinum TaxID=1974748 RepID=A0A2H0LSR3_9BACT|nr:MAG: hypothetical protein COV74_00680 [Candidatus Omnitrophica bacterium CG11_big_fil_rev_8_21_14_0_20_45_26]PIW64202.1 MAG: hypothetical protein COW12_07195 [Candidatus Omnitrophica bacterium CG12_big_fil_rev_8_21_14_0_65_45_16]
MRISVGQENQVLRVISLILIACLTFSCSSSRGSSANITTSQTYLNELETGKTIHQSIISRIPLYQDAELVSYVKEIGKSMLPYVKRQELPYQFYVLDDQRIYATSAPGGYVYITTGMILFVKDEAQLAAVLAHELGELQFPSNDFSYGKKIFQNVVQGASMAAPMFGSIGALVMVGLVGTYAIVNHKPSDEKKVRKADKAALDYMRSAGHDPQGYLNFVQTVQTEGMIRGDEMHDYLESRPVSDKRIFEIEKTFKHLPLEDQSFDVHRENFILKTRALHLN